MSTMTIGIELVASSLGADNVSSMISKVNRLGLLARGLGGHMSGANQSLIGFGLAAAGTDAIFGALLNTVETGISDAGDLEMAITRLQLASGLSSDAFDNLKLAVVDMATHSLYSATESAGAFEKLTEMGFSASQVMYGMGAAEDAVTTQSYNSTEALQGVGRQAMAVGEAMRTDAVSGATLLGSTLHTFQHDSMSAADAANILVGTFYSGVPSAEALQAAINNSGAMADAAGIKFHDFATILGLLSQAGLPAEQAGTSLRYMIQSLIAPTQKQAETLAYLGIQVTHSTGYLTNLRDEMDKQGGAAAKAAKGYDGSVTSLKNIYDAAKKAHDVPLDETFNQWAEKNNLLNSSLFDSQGNFKGLGAAIGVLDQVMADKGLTMQQKMDVIASLFNVRSGRAAQILTNLKDFQGDYKAEWDKIGKTDALSNAMQVLSTFQGSITQLKTSLHSALAEAFMPLLKAITPLAQHLNDLVGAFLKLPSGTQGTIGVIIAVVTVLFGLAGIILTAVTAFSLLGAMGVSIGAILGTAAPIFAIVVGVIAAIAGAIALVLTHKDQIVQFFGQFRGVVQAVGGILQFLGQVWSAIWSVLGPTLADLGGIFKDVIQKNLDAIGQILKGTFLPAWQNLQQSLQNLAPLAQPALDVLKAIGMVIGTVLVVAIGFTIGVLSGLISAVITFIGGLVTFVSGIIQVIMGIFQILVGLWQIVAGTVMDIVTGHFDKIGDTIMGGLSTIWNGIKTILGGILTMILGLFQGVLGTIIAFVGGFIQGIISFFTHLFETLVGHSIVPDMVNAILKWINNLVNTFLTFIGNLVTRVVSFFLNLGVSVLAHITAFVEMALALANHFVNQFTSFIATLPDRVGAAILTMISRTQSLLGQLASIGLNAGKGLIDNVVSGITNGLGKIKGAVGNIAGAIGSVLHHSVPEEGPLKDDDQWGGHLVDNIITGMSDRIPNLSLASTKVAQAISGPITTPQTIANQPVSVAGQSGQIVIPVNFDGKQVAEYVVDLGTRRVRQSGSSRYAR